MLSQATLLKGGTLMAKKIIDYKLLEGGSYNFEEKIKEYIQNGYQPYGNPFPYYEDWARNGMYSTIYQAMVKYEE